MTMIHLHVALAQRIIFLTSDGDDNTIIIIIPCMGLGLGLGLGDKIGNAGVRFPQTPDTQFECQCECQVCNEEKHHEAMCLWYDHVSYYFANIIFLRVLPSLLPVVGPLRECNRARPLHDMSKYFNPFFPNTLAVQSEIAFLVPTFLSTALMHLHSLVAKMSSAFRFRSAALKFSNGIW